MSARGKHRVAGALLVALPLVLPFEAPLFSVGPLLLTSAELALYLVLGAWGLGVAWSAARAGSWRGAAARLRAALGLDGGDLLPRATTLWLAVVIVSAIAAPAYRGAALKFALRTLSGGLLFFAARDLVRDATRARRVTLAILAGAAISAAVAMLELALPGLTTWEHFRPGMFAAAGLHRATGAFAYPTIAAMYWEAALPLAIAVPLGIARFGAGAGARARLAPVLAVAVAALLAAAMLRSATRAALTAAALGSAAMLILGWRRGPRVRLAAGGALGALVVLSLGMAWGVGADARFGQRLRWWKDGSWFRASYEVPDSPLTMATGATVDVPVTVRNTGALSWPHEGSDAVNLSYHWETRGAAGPRLDFEGLRTPLPADLPPGAAVEVLGHVQAPNTAGSYQLRWDMVREEVTWFSFEGNPTSDQLVEVVPGGPPARTGRKIIEIATTLEDLVRPAGPPRPQLWRAAVLLWRRHPILGVGPDNFRRLYPEVVRTASGQAYTDDRLHANSLYFETLADLGLAGVAVLAVMMLGVARALRARVARGRDGSDGGAGYLALACVVAAGLFFVHGALDYFLEFTPTYGLYWLMLALASGAWLPPSPLQRPAGVAPDGGGGPH